MQKIIILLLLFFINIPFVLSKDRHEFNWLIDLRIQDTTSSGSWLESYFGKFRFDSNSNSLAIGQALLSYKGQLTDVLQAQVTANYYQQPNSVVGLNEAFIDYKPIPQSNYSHRIRAGAFYPKFSVENVDIAWTSPYSLNNSAINTWIGEEVKAAGFEYQLHRDARRSQSSWDHKWLIGTFQNNDTIGSLIAWKGWGLHDRQTLLSEKLPLPQVNSIQTGGSLQNQAEWTRPFKEVDNKWGYYLGYHLQYQNKFQLKLYQYDNRADPKAEKGGQYAWKTEFNSAALKVNLYQDLQYLAQYMHGTTYMGPDINGYSAVAVGFHSHFSMLTQKFKDKHRISIRYDEFKTIDKDYNYYDHNDEFGYAWTSTYFYTINKNLRLGLEYSEIKSKRPNRYDAHLPITETEESLQLSVRWKF